MPAWILSLAGLTRPDRSRARNYLVSAIKSLHRIQRYPFHQRYEPHYHPSKKKKKRTTFSSSNGNNNKKSVTTRSIGLTVSSPNYTRVGYLRPTLGGLIFANFAFFDPNSRKLVPAKYFWYDWFAKISTRKNSLFFSFFWNK